MLRIISLSLSLLFALSFSLMAQERGRLPDGRAFRTDSNGAEIVDYIAELELINADLKERIIGLENELDERARLLKKDTPSQFVAEKQCDDKKLAQIQQQLTQEQGRSNRLQSQLSEIKLAYQSQEKDLETLRGLHRSAISDQRKEDAQIVAQLKTANAKLKSEISDKLSELETLRRDRMAKSQSDMRLSQELETTRVKLNDALKKLKQFESRASLRPAAITKSAQKPAVKRDYVALFKKYYQEVRHLHRRREVMAQKLARANAEIRLSRQAPKSRRGVSLSQISSRYKVIAKKSANAKLFIKDLMELKSTLDKDIALATRVLNRS